jgi:hypothetical protein
MKLAYAKYLGAAAIETYLQSAIWDTLLERCSRASALCTQ